MNAPFTNEINKYLDIIAQQEPQKIPTIHYRLDSESK